MMKLLICLALCVCAIASAAPNENSYKWAEDWVADQKDFIEEAQGASTQNDELVCCLTATPQCKVQIQNQETRELISVKNQATRAEFTPVTSVIILLKEETQYQYQVNKATNGSLICQEKCPLQEGFPPLTPGFLPFNATYMGKKAPEGISGCPTEGCDLWQIKQVILGIIVMETDDFYVYTDAKTGQGVPVAQISHLTPFGEPLGEQTTSWAGYTGYPDGLPASDFEILNKESCPPPKNGCQQQQQTEMYAASYRSLVKATKHRPWARYVTDDVRSKFDLDFEALDRL